MAPILIPVLVAARSITNAQAASLLSYVLAGQIVAALVATRFRFDQLSRLGVTGIFVLYASALGASMLFDTWLLFTGCWFLVGLACGFLMQFGIVTAATSQMKLQAFAFRLSGALLFSGLMAISIYQFDSGPGYPQVIAVFCAALTLIFLIGLVFWTNGVGTQSSATDLPTKHLTGIDCAGLFLLFLFFAGQVGYLANSAYFTTGNGISLSETSFAIALSKILISIAVLLLVLCRTSNTTVFHQLVYSGFLAAAAALIFTQNALVMVVSAYIAFELFLNLTSAAFMASLSDRFSLNAKNLILIFTLLGALAGSPFAGYLIDNQLGLATLALAIAAAFLPLFWMIFWRRKS